MAAETVISVSELGKLAQQWCYITSPNFFPFQTWTISTISYISAELWRGPQSCFSEESQLRRQGISHMQARVKFFLSCLQSANIRDTSVALSIQTLFYNVANKHVQLLLHERAFPPLKSKFKKHNKVPFWIYCYTSTQFVFQKLKDRLDYFLHFYFLSHRLISIRLSKRKTRSFRYFEKCTACW